MYRSRFFATDVGGLRATRTGHDALEFVDAHLLHSGMGPVLEMHNEWPLLENTIVTVYSRPAFLAPSPPVIAINGQKRHDPNGVVRSNSPRAVAKITRFFSSMDMNLFEQTVAHQGIDRFFAKVGQSCTPRQLRDYLAELAVAYARADEQGLGMIIIRG